MSPEKRTAEEFRRTYNGIRQSGMDDTHQAEIPRFHYVVCGNSLVEPVHRLF